MAILKDLIVSGSSRLLGKLYANDIEIGGTAVFTSLSTTGNATIGGTLGVTGATTHSGKITVNNVIEQHGDGIELYYSRPHIDFHYENNTADYTSRIIESAQGVITITPKLSTSTADITTANITTANTNKINNTDMITTSALDVKGKLHAVEYDLENIMDLGGSFVVAPTLIVPSSGSGTKTLTVTKSNNTTVVMTVRDPSITSGGIAGFAWANNYKVKVSGLVNNTVLGTCDGYINTTNVGSNTISLTVTMDAATVTAIATTVSTYKLNIMLYNTDTSSATAVTKPLGIYLQHYQLTNNPIINVWNGQTTTPKVRIGYLGGITYNGSSLGTNAQNSWGLYSDSVFLEGQIIANGGKIGGYSIGTANLTKGTTQNASGSFWLTPEGQSSVMSNLSSSAQTWAMTVGQNFGVTTAGAMYTQSGYIATWKIESNDLSTGTWGSDNSAMLCTGTSSSKSIGGSSSINGWVFTAGSKFGVTKTGALYCNDIHATGGTISGSLVSSGISASNITTGTLSADRIATGAIAIGKLDTSTQTKINNGDAAKTALNNYGYLYKKDIVIYGESNKYYPVYFVGGEQNVTRETLISRGYSEQAPSDWNTSTHKGGLTFRVKWNFGGWGGATYKAAILDFSEMYSTMVAQVRAGYDSGLTGVVWLRGGGTTGAIYHIYSDQPVEAEIYGCNAPYIGLTEGTVFMQSGSSQWKVAAPLTAPNTVELKNIYTDEYANSFITNIDSNGIWVTPSGKKPTNTSTGAGATGTKIDGTNGVQIFENGVKLAQYSSGIKLYQPNGTEVVNISTSGATFKGSINATGGFIGQNETNGFKISSSAIYNPSTKSTLGSDTVDGVYLGKDGIALGKGTFKVDKTGALTSTSGKIGGWTISTNGLYCKSTNSRTGFGQRYVEGTAFPYIYSYGSITSGYYEVDVSSGAIYLSKTPEGDYPLTHYNTKITTDYIEFSQITFDSSDEEGEAYEVIEYDEFGFEKWGGVTTRITPNEIRCGNLECKNLVINPDSGSASNIYGKHTDSSNGLIAQLNANDNYVYAYTGYYHSIGSTNIYGNNISMMANGTIKGNKAYQNTSDIRLKKDIVALDDMKTDQLLLGLKPFEHKWIDNENNDHVDSYKHFGVSAQEVLSKMSDLGMNENDYYITTKDDDGYYYVAYSEFIPMLIHLCQTQQKDIEELKCRISKLESCKGGTKNEDC